MNKPNRLRYGIVGAGAAGLTLAWHLARSGHEVVIYERERGLGGLASDIPFGNTKIDRFYHHIFNSDTTVQKFAELTGLTSKLHWCESSVGFEHQGRLYPFTKPTHLLRFSPLSLFSRFRTGLAILRMGRQDDYLPLESITAEQYIIQTMGEQAYRVLWEPLLRSKFGDRYRDVSAVWFWGKVKLRGGTRSKKTGGEILGYMQDGWGQLYDRMGETVIERGAELRTGQLVRKIGRVEGSGRLWIKTRSGVEEYDRVIVTPSVPSFLKMVDDLPEDYRASVSQIPYQANITMILGVERSLSPYYWLNITSPDSPFVAVIEHTNLFQDPNYGGMVPIYLSRYLSEDHPLYKSPMREVKAGFLNYLQRVFPQFDPDALQHFTFSKALYTQPVIGLHYSKKRPSFETPLPNLYLCTMVQIYPEDRGQNYSMKMAETLLSHLDEPLHDR